MERFCIKCSVVLTEENWHHYCVVKKHYICTTCFGRIANIKKKRKRLKNKEKALEKCGGCFCSCCGENIIHFLNIDHKNNNGIKERRESGLVGVFMHEAIIKGKETNDLRVLCYNCNCARGNYGFCPHELKHLDTGSDCLLCGNKLILESKHNIPTNFHEFLNKSGINICFSCIYKHKSNKTVDYELRKCKRRIFALRTKVLNAYGGRCECCDESRYIFLTIDHIKYFDGLRSSGLYKYLIKNNFPKDNYRILCYNCNCGRGHNGSDGICPHKKQCG